MKIVVSTSDNYHHCLPIFLRQFAKFWDEPFDLVGYKRPDIDLPENCTWISMGEQGPVSDWSTDLRAYFSCQDDFFIWIMEDTFIRGIYPGGIEQLKALCSPEVGRINLTDEGTKQDHVRTDFDGIVANTQTARYRLSTQPSIWNREFLLQYLTEGLTPWDFETQESTNDGWVILGPVVNYLEHNEGVRRHNIYKLNLENI